jgi:CheY-like chemotaxis protein
MGRPARGARDQRERDEYILLVDDDEDLREVLAEILRENGYRIVTAANGKEALEHLHANPRARVILLDLMMPVMNGCEFRAAQIRDPELAEIPVVVLSADDQVRRKAERLGADAFLRKPMNVDTLLDTVDRPR